MSAVIVFLLMGFVGSVFPIPLPFPNVDFNTLDEVDSGLLDLSYLGDKIFGVPSLSSGNRLEAWHPSSRSNPDEIGEYAEGDILFPPTTSRNGLKAESTRWPRGIVPYVIEGGYSSEERDNIMRAIADYHRQTCIRFTPWKGEADYLTIGNKKTGCWSSVGKTGGKQDVNLQRPGCVSKVGVPVHELMHALGFLHEQSRVERDNFVQINLQNIKPGEEYNFKKATDQSTDGFGVQYDYDSVMHYGAYAFSLNNKPTIVPKKSGVTIGQREGLSSGDARKLNTMYKCKNPHGGSNNHNNNNNNGNKNPE